MAALAATRPLNQTAERGHERPLRQCYLSCVDVSSSRPAVSCPWRTANLTDRFFATLGCEFGKLREAEGWSQEGFAEHCNLHRTYVGAIERGERNLAILNIRKIAAALGVSMSKLLEGVS